LIFEKLFNMELFTKVCWVVGKIGTGKSTTLNHIISNSPDPRKWLSPFAVGDDIANVTETRTTFVDESDLILFTDVPGLSNPNKFDKETVKEIQLAFDRCKRLPTVLMVMLNLRTKTSPTFCKIYSSEKG